MHTPTVKKFVSAVGTGVPDGPKQTSFGCKPAMLKMQIVLSRVQIFTF